MIIKLIFSIILVGCSSFSDIRKVDLLPHHTRKQHEAFSDHIMITSQGIHSTLAGIEIAKSGGNVFDIAAAVSFAISVERPQSTGLGGGGFMLIDGPQFKAPTSLDFREMAPSKAHADMFLNSKGDVIKGLSLDGPLSSGVPGLVHGILSMHEKYGKLPRHLVMKPSIQLAEEGFEVYPHLANAIETRSKVLKKYPASKKIFFKDEAPLKIGDLIVQKDLAKTLRAISEHGINGFYKGWVSQAIAKEMSKRKGLITLSDLENYKTVERKPIEGNYKDYQVYSMGPPSSGGTHIIQILNILEPYNLKELGVQSNETIHKVSSAMQLSFIDRAKYMGDSDFVDVPLKNLTSKKYAKKLRSIINDKALKINLDRLIPNESSDTTHFTIMDSEGNTVTSTQTINYLFGSGLVIPETGIVMNDEMDDFSSKPGSQNVFGAIGGTPNKIEALKRPLSSMSPTIIKKNGKTIMALGTPSGTRILTCVAQTILNHLEFELPLFESISATRFHHQWRPDQLMIESPYFSNKTLTRLRERGYSITKKDLGCKIQAITKKGQEKLHGVSDPRGEGLAKGISFSEAVNTSQ